MRKIYFIFTLLEMCVWTAQAQPLDTNAVPTLLNQVEILGLRPPNKDTLLVRSEMSSISLHLGQYLQANGYGQIQAYGPEGTLNYLRFRGSSSDHTTVYWNDIPLNSITLGGVDVSMVPLFFIDGIEHDRTQNQSTRQWNNVSNGLFLKSGNILTSPSWNVRMFQSYNSMQNASSGLEWGWHRRVCNKGGKSNVKLPWTWSGTSRLFYQTIANEFKYTDAFQLGDPTIRQVHNDGWNKGWMQNLALSHGQHRWEADLWLQKRQMALPLQLGQLGQSTQEQDDAFYRMSIRYLYSGARIRMKWAYAENREEMNYRDMLQSNGDWSLNSSVRALSRFVHTTWSKNWGAHLYATTTLMGLQNQVLNSNYTGHALRQNYGQSAADLKWQWNKHAWMAGARKEWRSTPTSWNWNLAYMYSGYWAVVACSWQTQLLIAHRFRTPDLNDLYWIPGGNPNLLPEEGNAYEWHTNFQGRAKGPWRYSAMINAYHTDMTRLIVWMPETSGIWAPHNAKKVSTEGLDVAVNVDYKGARWNGDFRQRVQWNKSLSEGRYMPYSPEWIHSSVLRFGIPHWLLETSVTYTSMRFTESMNKKIMALDAYRLWNANLQWLFNVKDHSGFLTFGVCNILDLSYQSVRGMAMPGRYYQMQFIYQLTKYQNLPQDEKNTCIQRTGL